MRCLVSWRKRAGKTQKDVAEALGVSQSAVSQWESGEVQIPLSALRVGPLAPGLSGGAGPGATPGGSPPRPGDSRASGPGTRASGPGKGSPLGNQPAPYPAGAGSGGGSPAVSGGSPGAIGAVAPARGLSWLSRKKAPESCSRSFVYHSFLPGCFSVLLCFGGFMLNLKFSIGIDPGKRAESRLSIPRESSPIWAVFGARVIPGWRGFLGVLRMYVKF